MARVLGVYSEAIVKAYKSKRMQETGVKLSISEEARALMKAEASEQAMRFNDGKPKLSYNSLGKEANEGSARVWESGSKKYTRGNWLKGAPFTELVDSLERHLDAFLSGEDIDSETGLPHVDHIQCNAKMLSQSFHTKPDMDDRVK